MAAAESGRGHYQRLEPAGDEEHPVDRLVAALPEVATVDRDARRMGSHLAAHPRARLDAAGWVRYEDLRLLQRTIRQEAYFDAGWEMGAIAAVSTAAAPASVAAGRAGAELAGAVETLTLAVTRLTVATSLGRDRAAAVLLEIARGLILGGGRGPL